MVNVHHYGYRNLAISPPCNEVVYRSRNIREISGHINSDYVSLSPFIKLLTYDTLLGLSEDIVILGFRFPDVVYVLSR